MLLQSLSHSQHNPLGAIGAWPLTISILAEDSQYGCSVKVQVLVPHTLSLAWRLGHAVATAQHAKQDPADAIAAKSGGQVLFKGA